MENVIYEYKCEQCPKVFTMKKNLKRHISNVHDTDKPHQCSICEKTFARKQHKELHLKTCAQKGEGVKQQEGKKYKKLPCIKFSPIIRTSAFGGIYTDWMIKFPDDYHLVDPRVLLQKAVKAMTNEIEKHLHKDGQRLKFTMSVFVVFEKAGDPETKTIPSVVFTTTPYEVRASTDLNKCLDDTAHELYHLIEVYEGNGSGWVIDHLTRLDTRMYSF